MMIEKKNLQGLLRRISIIKEESDTQRRLELLLDLNDSLPQSLRLTMPSLITNAYVRRALDLIEERIARIAINKNHVISA